MRLLELVVHNSNVPRGKLAWMSAAGRRLLARRVPDLRLLGTAREVQRSFGKPVWAQICEIVALRRGPGLVRPFDYYAYHLFDDRQYSPAQKQAFVGWNYKECLTRIWTLNDPAWAAICDDKLVAYALFAGLRLPCPEVYALYHPGGRTFRDVPTLETEEEMADFLRHEMQYPFFGKPVSGAFGRGASYIAAFDASRDAVIDSTGSMTAVDDYVRSFPARHHASRKTGLANAPGGYLFQAPIVQHPLVHRLSGGRVSSLRMVVLLDGPTTRLFRVTWKLPVGNNITDHAIGTSGNIKCLVDPTSGRVEHVLRGRRDEHDQPYALGYYGVPVDAHPDTGETLRGIQLPDWEHVVGLCLRAARALPGLRYQSWDMVMGIDGPQFLEINAQGGIAQMPGGPGLNDETFQRFLSSAGSSSQATVLPHDRAR